jgi:hypothetical protein
MPNNTYSQAGIPGFVKQESFCYERPSHNLIKRHTLYILAIGATQTGSKK